jgi:putative hemolysin
VSEGYLLLLLVLLLASAFFSGTETAYFSLSRVFLKKMENSESRSTKRVIKLLRHPRRLLISLLLGNTFVNLAISSLSTVLALDIAHELGLRPSLVLTIQIIAITIIIVMFGEIIPKLVALSTANTFAQAVSIPLQIIRYLLFPLVWIVEKISLLISKKQVSDPHLNSIFTKEEFHNLIQSENLKHGLEEHEKQILAGLYRFREAKLTEIYVPRVKIKAIASDLSIQEIKDFVISAGHSRIPVYKGTIDEIVGIIYAKDLILYPEKTKLIDIMRPAWFVTGNMKVSNLLNQFKTRKLQMAIVVDEYGGTSGLISLEDILEMIVGEINDENDQDATPDIEQVEQAVFSVKGDCNIREFNHVFGVEIDPEEFDNLAEFLLSVFNHVPLPGEKHLLDNVIEFMIMEADGRSIKQVRITKLAEE